MNPEKLNRIILITLAILFCTGMIFFEKYTYKDHKAHVDEHANIIQDALWNLDYQGPVEYLKMAAQYYNYESIQVFAVDKEKAFLSVKGPEKNKFSQILIKAGLIPRLHLDADIIHQNRKIGLIKVVLLHATIYVYCYVLLIMVLILLAVRFFIQTVHAKNVLEEKVQERTTELKRSEERLDLALSAANEGIWDWDLEEDTLHFDARFYLMAGYDPNEFPAKFEEWEKRVHPDDIQQTLSSIRQYLSGDTQDFDIEFRYRRKENDYMWIQGKGKIVARNEKGDPTRFIGTHSDITERKQMEKSLRLTQFSFDKAAIGIYHIASDARILNVNAHAAKSLGYTIEELEDLSIIDIDPLINKNNWGEIWQRLLKNGLDNFETIHQGKDGRQIHVEITANSIEYDGQQFSIAFAQDISERKKAEEEIRKLQNYLSNIIDSMPSLIVGVDSDGLVTQWNHMAEKATGISGREARGKIVSDILPQLAVEKDKIIQSIQSHQVMQEQKKPFETKNGTLYQDLTIYPLTANGEKGAVIRIDDVTDKVRLEEVMVQSEKMLSVGGLAAGMAHEINNPLAGMIQNANVMKTRLEDLQMPANLRAADDLGIPMEGIKAFMEKRGILKMVGAITESGSRVAEIVDNMLSFARKSDAAVSSHNPAELMDQILKLAATDYDLKKQYDFKTIKIIKEYEDNLPILPCEGAKIQQVILNILRNGAQAMQAETKDNGAAPCFILRLAVEKKANMLKIEVEDNGPGMNEETLKRIFEPFFTTKPPGLGTGLGLSVSYFIITKNHGGTIDAESIPGKGSTFIVRLPLVRGGKKNGYPYESR